MDQTDIYRTEYRLLDRLNQDCMYYITLCANGIDPVRAQGALWAGTVEQQIAKMHELWNLLPEKPEWLTEEEIDCMEELLVGLRDGRIDPENPFQQPEASDMEHDER